MTRARIISRTLAILLLCGMLGWGVWLLSMRKDTLDYLIAEANVAPALPDCQWTPVSALSLTHIGLSFDPGHAWTDRRTAYLGFRTGKVPFVQVDLLVAGIAGSRIGISADHNPLKPLSEVEGGDGVVRLALGRARGNGVHTITIKVSKAKPPHGAEQRWLGLAISKVRACGRRAAPSGEW